MLKYIFDVKAASHTLSRLALEATSPLLKLESWFAKKNYRSKNLEAATDTLYRAAAAILLHLKIVPQSFMAAHEAGHAIFALNAFPEWRLRSIGIIDFNDAGGWLMRPVIKISDTCKEEEYLKYIAMKLAGYAGEKLIHGELAYENLSNGVTKEMYDNSSDTVEAKKLALEFCMKFPNSHLNSLDKVMGASQTLADEVLRKNKDQLKSLTNTLNRHLIVTETEIDKLRGREFYPSI